VLEIREITLLLWFVWSCATVCLASPSDKPMSSGVVNAIQDCGLKGDGVTDDLPSFNACRDAHPGTTILFPKTRPAGSSDYYFSGSLIPKGH